MSTNPEELADWLGLDEHGAPPPLHEDLVPYLVETGVLGLCLQHPLVYQVPYTPMLAGHANAAYTAKRAAVADALADQDWAQLLMWHERPYRLWAFSQIHEAMSDPDYWQQLARLWVDTENLWQNGAAWRRYLRARRPGRAKHFMDDDDRAALAALGPEITVFRGTSAPDGMGAGLSWTLDRDRAVWFARRFADIGGPGRPVLLTGTVPKRNVVAYVGRRNESEIIAFPAHVTITGRGDIPR